MPDKDDKLIFEAYLLEGIEAPLRNTALKIIEIWNELHGILIPQDADKGSGDETTSTGGEGLYPGYEDPETIGGKEIPAQGKYTGNEQLADRDIRTVLQGGLMNQNDELKAARKEGISYINFINTVLNEIMKYKGEVFYTLQPGSSVGISKDMYPQPRPEHLPELVKHIEGISRQETQKQAQMAHASLEPDEEESDPNPSLTLPQLDDEGNINPDAGRDNWEGLIDLINKNDLQVSGGKDETTGKWYDGDSPLEYVYKSISKDLVVQLEITEKDVYVHFLSLSDSATGSGGRRWPAEGEGLNLAKKAGAVGGGIGGAIRVAQMLGSIIDSWRADDPRWDDPPRGPIQ